MAVRHSRIVDRVLTRLKLKQLRLLVAVGKHNNIQNAARELNVSQPAATKMIKDLELDFEVQLFERTNRGVIPTPYGEALIRHGKLIFAQVSNAAQELDDLNEGSSGRIVIGTLLAASPQLLPMAIEKLLHRRPSVSIKVVEGTNEVLMPALKSGEIDLVVGRLPAQRHRSDLEQLQLFDEKILLVARRGHPICANHKLSFDDLKSWGWILPPIETTLRRQLDQFFVRQGQYAPAVAIESVSYLTNRAVLQAGDFIGLMPAHVAAQDIASGLLQEIPWSLPIDDGPVGVSFRSADQLSPAATVFLQALQDVAASM
ncbi:LysR substrate-binding domain-containing protein [Parasedimentitalea huanghaiensis]|uniref:LysR family transcriptional regulator n=1 Tax=Parasedimentitalea huanghaiensis TaxID=2682100 RepID=A0A6L6WL18_9RHOB|nr:LysR substrate-binding domain-containing protein [Zongyanglinia huanghaiensis]MVO18050.1 LysR family transcriptional regulator [Zongyanglinia huanghaiensis]